MRKIKEKIVLTRTQEAYLLSKINTIHFKKNDFFITPGETCTQIGYINTGLLRVFNVDSYGNEITNWLITDGELATEILSFLNQEPTQEYIQCIENTTMEYFTYQDLQEIYKIVPEMHECMKLINEELLISIKKYILSNIHLSAEERYEQLLKVRPKLFQKAPLKHIASFLGMTDSTLSRVRRKLLVT
ncbi:Crp/Fnr family transcriptional regulator [Kordia sp.]|uniref:Crp/Fnr family transcriptional regulator n=1 Tax=Kordia sp. TaxID=1965332 RepID=UPI003B58C0F0